MTRISARPLKAQTEKKLFSELAQIIARADKKNAEPFLQALLTPTEQIMIAKRIGVLLLLHTKVPTYQIVRKLHMSSQTVVRMRTLYKKGAYDSILKFFTKHRRDLKRFVDILEIVLYGGFPSRVGLGRYTFLQK